MVYIVLFCIYLLISFIFNSKNNNRKILILFDGGFFLYLIFPLIILKLKLLKEIIVIKNYYYLNYDSLTKIIPQLILLLFFLNLSFKIPFYFTSKRNIKNKNINKGNISEKIIFLINKIILVIIIGMSLFNYKVFTYRYKYFGNFRSVLATLIIIFFLNVMYLLVKKKKSYSKMLIVYFLLAFILVVMGSRMYFIMGIVSYLFYLEVNFKINKKKILMLLIFIFIGAGYITIYRYGGKFDIVKLSLNNSFEFLFTGISYITFINYNEIPYISMPNQLISALSIFVPSFLFRSQSNYISDYIYFSPLGAKNLFVSLMENFGVIFSLLFLFFLGLIIKKSYCSKNKIIQTWFYFIVGAVPFMLFRDPLETFLYKICFEYSIFILFLEYIITLFFKKLKTSIYNKIFRRKEKN